LTQAFNIAIVLIPHRYSVEVLQTALERRDLEARPRCLIREPSQQQVAWDVWDALCITG
jgi:hypothetical protein